MEHWEQICKSIIPVGKYKTLVKNGEDEGLFIILESKEHIVNIDFGAVSALRMLDEGIILEGIFDDIEISKHKESNFSNAIYKIHGGEFASFIKKACNELYDFLNLNHYIIITINYVIEVISGDEPSIEVLKK